MYAYIIYKLGAFLAQRLSLPTARKYAAVVGRLMCLIQRRNRRHLYRNLEIAFGDELGPRELKRLRRDIFANFAAFVAEYLWLPKIDRHNIRRLLTPESPERYARLQRLAEERGPVIYLTAHLGNWELGGAAASLLGMPLTVLVDAHPSPLVTHFFDARREEKGMTVVPVTSFQRVFRALRGKQLVAIVGDRPVTGQGILAPFFGTPALVPDGHALLARKFGAAIVPGFLVMNEEGLYDLIVEDVIEPRVTDDEEADIRDCVERCLAVFEKYIRRHPEQWYVFRPVWDRPDERYADRLKIRQERFRARAAERRRREAARSR
jgi:KDO2-lipid IV(A) lauroyltransferase